MKYSVAAVSAFAAVALAKPEFLNSSFQVIEGEPFTLKYSGCDTGCTITLQTGTSTNLKDVKVLTTTATGSSTAVTLEDIPSGIYSFKITDKSGQFNYSVQFPVQGSAVVSSSSHSSASSATTAAESTTASATSEPATTTAASTTAEKSSTFVKSTTAHTSTTEAESTTTHASSTPKHNSTTAAIPTGGATTTTVGHHSSTAASTSSNPAITTVPPGSAAGRLSSPIALVAGVALALAFFS